MENQVVLEEEAAADPAQLLEARIRQTRAMLAEQDTLEEAMPDQAAAAGAVEQVIQAQAV